MNKIIKKNMLRLFISLLFFVACQMQVKAGDEITPGLQAENTISKPTFEEDAKEAFQSATSSWYKMIKGAIDKYPVTLHLHKAAHQYSGFYYYDQQQQPIYFNGNDTSQPGKITLLGVGSADENETFLITISGEKVAGTWKKTDKSKGLPFNGEFTSSPVAFQFVYTVGEQLLRPKLKIESAPTGNYFAASVWPEGNTRNEILIKNIARRFFNNKSSGDEIGGIFLRGKKAFFMDYVKTNKEAKDSEIKEMPNAYNFSDDNQLLVCYQSPKLLNLALKNYSYTGGAHGNYGTTYVSVDLLNSKELQLSDIVTPQANKILSNLLEKSFRKAFNIKAGESLQSAGVFDKVIKPNKNFFLTSKGLSFNYTPYEIGPYAMGEVSLFIPIDQVAAYLTPAAKSSL